ncbi:hypothetical protein [Flavisolibacter ginsenosidimutans]|uniref:DNA polymerase III subunit psi n=1 Tax=Flavisolibacter ginsenosidimutans TaxID=661481 RepID=A0A5B8UHU4_9BACT|nr:hypothetical protein [Flavisolibacter ginsenosidimutans]QEC56002.1 hypothetical protein FSB75_08885 [Flavisolibacter ginsenosidimutans]
MSLNNISLPPSLLADLYANVLVQSQTGATAEEKPVSFLGKNKKHILILVNQTDAAYLPEKELQFLTAVLSACQLDLSHVAIVNWALLEEKSLAVLQRQLSPQKLLLLDIKPEEAGLPEVQVYAVQAQNEFEFVAAPALAEIEKTKQAKSNLWVALKQLFCL